MLKVFNTRGITSQQRFLKACLFGIPAAIGLGLANGFVSRIISFNFQIIYLAVGYGIAWVIKETGRGIQPKFSILAAVLTLFAFIVSAFVLYYPVSLNPLFIVWYIESLFGSIWGLIEAFFIVSAIGLAYRQARMF